MATTRKQIAFDLDTNALKAYYPSEGWNHAYDVIQRHMEKRGFKHLQGSVYVSKEAISSYRVAAILEDLVNDNPWLNKCMRDCRETNIGREHSKNYIFDKEADIPAREHRKRQSESDVSRTITDFFEKKEQIGKSEEKPRKTKRRILEDDYEL